MAEPPEQLTSNAELLIVRPRLRRMIFLVISTMTQRGAPQNPGCDAKHLKISMLAGTDAQHCKATPRIEVLGIG